MIHFGKREIVARIEAMEPVYEEVLTWVDPDPDNADAAPADVSGPWGEGIHVFGEVKPLKGCRTPNLMADSYGFSSSEELSRVQKYLQEHGGWQLEQVSCRLKRLRSLVINS